MNRRKIHILYEHGADDLRPFSSAYIRLLRPFLHPTLPKSLDVTWGPTYDGQEVDAVIMDRFWRPDVSLELVGRVLDQVHRAGDIWSMPWMMIFCI